MNIKLQIFINEYHILHQDWLRCFHYLIFFKIKHDDSINGLNIKSVSDVLGWDKSFVIFWYVLLCGTYIA